MGTEPYFQHKKKQIRNPCSPSPSYLRQGFLFIDFGPDVGPVFGALQGGKVFHVALVLVVNIWGVSAHSAAHPTARACGNFFLKSGALTIS